MSDEWISTKEAANILGVAESTVYRWLADDEVRQDRFGDKGVGWRRKPVIRRKIYQVSRKAVEALRDPDDAE